MKTSNKIGWALICLFFAGIVSISFLKNSTSAQEAVEIAYSGDIDQDVTLTKDQKVFFDGETNIINGKTLTIEEGVEITFRGNYASLNVNDGKIVATGTAGKKIIFKKEDDEHASYAIFFNSHEYQSSFRYVEIVKGGAGPFYIGRGFVNESLIKTANAQFYDGEAGNAAIEINGGKLKMENSEFKDSLFQDIEILPTSSYYDPNEEDEEDGIITVYLAEVEIIDTNFSTDRALEAEQCDFYFDTFNMHYDSDRTFCREKVYLKNNYYGDADGPNIDVNGEEEDSEKGFYLKGEFKLDGWSSTKFLFEPEVSGASSVLFLPGVEASRLYEKLDMLGEYRLWEPRDRVEDLQRLYLDNNGNSISDGIYTKDIVDDFYGIVGIYGGFAGYMNDLVEKNTIKEWKPIPYDWRLPLEDIVAGRIKLENGEMDIIAELEALAGNSNTGKVTIIGHSNGGLLGKVLIDRLKIDGKENLVDKFIMVATPQVGTPKAMAGLLHGDKLGIPMTMLNRSTARDLVENMSSAYNLLPSEKYFDYVQTPVVEFEDDVKDIYDFEEIYGSKIDSKDELDKFLTGDDGKRSDPSFADTDSPNVVNENLLDKANNIHNNLLDNWQAPENMEVIQIAGWGLDTISGIKYDDCDIVFCPDKLSNLDRELVFKKDGDATVVVPSAIIMNDEEIYYVDIEKYNDGPTRNRDHASILEISNLQEFIKNIINNNRDLPSYITTVKPEVSDEDESLRYRMHSPVAVHLYDENNNHTGLTDNLNPESDLVYYEENIPNSYYIEFGETKYLGSPKNRNIRAELIGEDTGIFTFEIDELKGEDLDKNTTFKDIIVVKDMKAKIDISKNIGIMEVDWNNDDKIDAVINTEDESSASKASLKILEEIIKSSKINPILKNLFFNELRVAEKQIEKGKNKNAVKVLAIIKHQVETFSDKKMLKKLRINKAEAENLIKIIETVRLSLIK